MALLLSLVIVGLGFSLEFLSFSEMSSRMTPTTLQQLNNRTSTAEKIPQFIFFV